MLRAKNPRSSDPETYRGKKKYDARVADRYLDRSERRRGPENEVLGRILRDHGIGATLLDAPCGVGRVGALIDVGDFRYCGADLSSEMLSRARLRLAGTGLIYDLIRCDLEQLPFAPRSFDATLSLRFLHHLPPATRASVLRALARTTDRLLVVTYFHPFALHYLERRLQTFWKKLRGAQGPLRYSNTEGWLRRQLAPEGFRLVAGHGTGFLRETRYAVFERI